MLRTLADIHALERTPLDQADLPTSTYEMLRRSARRHGPRPALSFFASMATLDQPRTWTYNGLLGEIHRFANALHGRGYGAEDVVAYILPNLPVTHFVLWGAEANGIVLAINPQLSAEALGQLLQAAQAQVVVTLDGELGAKVRQALRAVSRARLLIEVEQGAGDTGTPARNALGEPLEVIGYGRFVEGQDELRLNSRRQFASDALSSYFCTGGTTGLPKIAQREHGNEVFDAYAMNLLMGEALGPGKTLFCGLPLFHANAQLVTGLAPWAVGAHVVLGTAQGYRGAGVIEGFWRIVERYRINFFSAVPTVYSALLQQPSVGVDIRSLALGMCGAAPMPVELFRRFEQHTGIRILEGYGLTEGACASSLNPLAGESRIGSIGLRFPYQAMRAVQLDGEGNYLRDSACDEIGVIALCGPNVFRGYLQAEHNRGIWLDLGDGQRWFNTGDMGRVDAEGYFWLTGRRKELIIRGGHNIDPQVIEAPLHRHPAVEMAAAIGRPDAHAGEVPVAYVKARAGSGITAAQLLDYLALEITEPAALPKRLLLVDELPLTAIGKLFKPALVICEIEDVVREMARTHGVHLTSLAVQQDPRHGYLARLWVEPASATLAQALGRFAFCTEILAHPSEALAPDVLSPSTEQPVCLSFTSPNSVAAWSRLTARPVKR